MSIELFLTSSPFAGRGEPLNSDNRFSQRLSRSIEGKKSALLVSAYPDDVEKTEEFSFAIRKTMELSGITFERYTILDSRNENLEQKLVQESELLILAGGHVPTQNRFFQKIGLRELMKNYTGTVLGISAGSMNSADVVYTQPELEGESIDPEYQRFLSGLNLTKCMILPHYQYTRDLLLDGKRLFEDITYPDSFGKQFIALPDGSYLYAKDGRETICGEAYRISDGRCEKICSAGEEIEIFGKSDR